MNTLAQAIFLAAQALPGVYAPPATAEAVAAERAAFLTVLAEELASAAHEATCTGPWTEYVECRPIWPGSAQELAALTLAIGFHESRLDPRIQKGDCKAWSRTNVECDGIHLPDGSIYFRAQSVFQLHGRFASPVVGLEWYAVRNAAKQAIRILAASRARCGKGPDWASGTFAAYAGTRTCSYRGAPARVATFRRIASRMASVE